VDKSVEYVSTVVTSVKVLLIGALATAVSLAAPVSAGADDYIDFGTNQAACKAAERQANAAGIRYSHCYETGPGHYSLSLDS